MPIGNRTTNYLNIQAYFIKNTKNLKFQKYWIIKNIEEIKFKNFKIFKV